MRVTFVASQTLPRNGMETALIRVARSLPADHEVSIVVLGRQPYDSGAGIPIRHIRCIGVRFIDEVIRVVALSQLLRRQRDGVVVACGVWAAIPVLLASGRGGPGVVVWEHSMLPVRVTQDRRLRLLLGVARHLYPRSRQVVCVSNAVANFVSSWDDRISSLIIPNLVHDPQAAVPDHLVVASRRCGDAVHVAAVGSLRPVKNVGLLVRAMAHLPERYSLTVLGDGPEAERLKREARRLGVHTRIEWLGHVDDPPAVLQARGTHVLAHPSRVETFGFSLFEAAELGLPVAALDAAIMNEVVPRFIPGVLSADEPAAFAAAIEAAARLAGDAAALSEAAARRHAAFSASTVVASWIECLAVASKPRSA